MKQKKEYSESALKELKKEAIFIFTDKDYHNFGRGPYKKQCITRMEEEPAELRADYVCKPQFSFMQQGTCCVDIQIEAPIHIWEVETQEQKESIKKILKEENKKLLEKTSQKHKKALKTGTEEYHSLAEINVNIQKYNDDWRQVGH